jgi:hypothetical protein
MVLRLQRLDYVPRLSLHDCNLFRVHALLEVCILAKAFPKYYLRFAPPLFRREKGEKMAACGLGERLTDE